MFAFKLALRIFLLMQHVAPMSAFKFALRIFISVYTHVACIYLHLCSRCMHVFAFKLILRTFIYVYAQFACMSAFRITLRAYI